ncbi:MAG: hypothetical protein AAF798_10830 [Bacteroidota bacterium]
MTEEKNKQTLDAALAKLKPYKAPAHIWKGIHLDLQQYNKEATLREAMAQLPTYKAPPASWEAIEVKLQQPERKRLTISWYHYAAAASVALLLSVGWYFSGSNDTAATIAFQYSEEVIDEGLFESDWEKDQADMQAIFAQFERSPQAKQAKQYEVLLVEYAELNDAKAEIEAIMSTYKNDASLVRQMSKIEIERSRIIKQMVSLI